MDRRNFFRIVGTTSGAAITGACGRPARELVPLLVPEQEIVPGGEEWHPSSCRECDAGCGTIVRVMEAEREVARNGGKVRERIAAIKKIEGNPLDPVSGGRLCARGQAAVESLYHPDRLRGPQKRVGRRGEAKFQPISWNDALTEAAALLKKAGAATTYLARPLAGSRSATIAAFLRALGAPQATAVGLDDFPVERRAAEIAFGWSGFPVYDLQDSDFVLSIGADFLGGWLSPVLYARRYGAMRQGRTGRRGRLVHAESRFSLTAGSADQWLPLQPGGELAFALAIGRVLVDENPVAREARLPDGLRRAFAAVDLRKATSLCGLTEKQIRGVAQDLARAERSVVLAGATVVQTNSVDAVAAANALNWLLGSVGRTGGVMAPSPETAKLYTDTRPRHANAASSLKRAQVVILDGVNPVYVEPATKELLAAAPSIISFSAFVDDSTAFADLILPDHDALETDSVAVPRTAPVAALTGAPSFVRPLHDTRATEDVLVELGQKIGFQVERDSSERGFARVARDADAKPGGVDGFAQECSRVGGWWDTPAASARATPPVSVPPLDDRVFDGSAESFPLYFQPYPSLQFGDGAGARLPWLQELPDPASSAMWGLPVEIDPGTAARLGLRNGDFVRVISSRAEIEAPVYVHPAAIPGVVGMAIGQGHTHAGRYASGRGANPLAVAAPLAERHTGAFAFGATRVRIEKTGRRGGLVQFAMVDREPEYKRR